MVWKRLPFMMLALFSLLAGLDAGLIRLGWNIPFTPLAVHHGSIMVGGFLSTLVALEKIIPLKEKIYFAVPVLNALSLLMVIPGLHDVGLVFLFAGGAGLLLIFGQYLLKQPNDNPNRLMLAGAIQLLVGHTLLLHTRFYPSAVMWWMGFILFIITAERLELSKFLPVTSKNKIVLLALLSLFPLSLTLPHHSFGKFITGVSLIGVALWLFRYDLIRIGLKKQGLTRYNAVALLSGNAWLLLSGLLLMFLKNDALWGYDSLIHCFFIGYVFMMIFAHGPIILPGVLGLIAKPYHTVLYVWLIVLQASLLLRVVSNAMLLPTLKLYTGVFIGLSILLFFVTLMVLMRNKKHASV